MKWNKLKIDDFRTNKLSKEKSKQITGGSNFDGNKENTILFSIIDPPKTDKPSGQQ